MALVTGYHGNITGGVNKFFEHKKSIPAKKKGVHDVKSQGGGAISSSSKRLEDCL